MFQLSFSVSEAVFALKNDEYLGKNRKKLQNIEFFLIIPAPAV